MTQLGAPDWRADYRNQFPRAAGWIKQHGASAELPVELVAAPTLLISGDADPISPDSVGRHLEDRMPNAKLHVLAGGDHSVAFNKLEAVAPLIAEHLQ
jgi:pimeloyl-ACP methyl ester carboxylesterase